MALNSLAAKLSVLLLLSVVKTGMGEDWAENCLKASNLVRRLHKDTNDLQWDPKLAQDAQKWAEVLKGRFLGSSYTNMEHARGTGQGENLWWQDQPYNSPVPCATAVLSWYSEVQNYNFNTHKKLSSCRPTSENAWCQINHMTQQIWRETTKIGMGIAVGSYQNGGFTWTETWIVARYLKPGNQLAKSGGDYTQNVYGKISGWKMPCRECTFLKTSGVCKKECIDTQSKCAKWKKQGYCTMKGQEKISEEWCPVTCGKCPSSACNVNKGKEGGSNAVDGKWSSWKNVGTCSASCGDGQQRQTRSCTNPRPSNGGAECSGNKEQHIGCNKGNCPSGGGDCKDIEQTKKCVGWKSHCKNHPYMKKYCKLTCGICGGGLVDKNGKCAMWASWGECSKNPGWMLPNCALSCSKVKDATSEHRIWKRKDGKWKMEEIDVLKDDVVGHEEKADTPMLIVPSPGENRVM